MVFRPGIALTAGCAADRIVQQGRSPDDVQVCAFSSRQALSDTVDPQNMIEIMDGVGVLVPDLSFFNCDRFHMG